MDVKEIGRKIYEERTKANLSLRALAKKAGVSHTSIDVIEKGYDPRTQKEASPTILTISKIATALGRDVSFFVPKNQKESQEVIYLPDSNVYMIPLFESVSAGFGAYANGDITSYEPCYIDSPVEASETICIKVKGDSMYPKIEDGDVIQIHKQTSVDSGQIAVVLLDGEEALVKKVIYGADWIELHSFNPMYPVMRFEGKDVLRLQVQGLVRKIVKKV